MEFEYDLRKSAANKKKHGIDFEEAQIIGDDPDFLEVPLKAEDEEHHMVIGKIGETYWSAIITYRQLNIRIISVRHARKEEMAAYES